MVERKRYVKPAIESEDAMEQTSLGCNATEGMPGIAPLEQACLAVVAVDGLTFGFWCETDVSKGGNFDEGCNTVALDEECVVVLS